MQLKSDYEKLYTVMYVIISWVQYKFNDYQKEFNDVLA